VIKRRISLKTGHKEALTNTQRTWNSNQLYQPSRGAAYTRAR